MRTRPTLLTRTWPEVPPHFWRQLDPKFYANFSVNLTRTFVARLTRTLHILDWLDTAKPERTHAEIDTGLRQSRDTASSPLLLITDRLTYRPTHSKPRPPWILHGRGPEGRARTQIPLGAPYPITTPTRPHGPYVPEGERTGAVMSAPRKSVLQTNYISQRKLSNMAFSLYLYSRNTNQ